MNPCRYCERRHIGCHSECKDYKAFKERLDEANKVKRTEAAADNIIKRYYTCRNWNYQPRDVKRGTRND